MKDCAALALYGERHRAAEKEVASCRERERQIANLRLWVFVAGIAVAWFVFERGLPFPLLVAVAVAFALLVYYHAGVIRRRQRGERVVACYAHGLARLDGTWPEHGVLGEEYSSADHPYAADLDIFGHGSLFQLLCIARTALGQSTLADWLRGAAAPSQIARRRVAVEELRDDVDRREALALIGDEIAGAIDADHLRGWAAAPLPPSIGVARGIAAGLVALTLVTLVLQRAAIVPAGFFLLALGLQAAFGLRCRQRVKQTARSLEVPAAELDSLAGILEQIETSDFAAPPLRALKERLATGDTSASAAIVRLHKLIQLLDARRNQIFAALAPLLLWGTQSTLAIESWRREYGPRIGMWLAVAGEYEALSCLSGFAYENLERTTWPQVEPAELRAGARSAPRFAARELRHPLMPSGACVGNDVALGGEPALLVVSGSNMSGKSTLLRSIGVNAVLAQAGAPVCAAELRMTPLQVGTSMRVQDSLLDGTSKFYAEIKRLKRVVDLTSRELSLLFLLDEVLHGTNSHDRRIGAAAIVETLLNSGAIGLITTHDLKLTEVVEELGRRARNVHFADQLVAGEMVFDYKMHDGPVRKSNALGLMRAIGLEV